MTVQVHRFDRARSMRWANDGGVTREIFRSPSEGPTYDWRVSIADVERDGPFSALPGVDRTIVLCDGDRMILTVDGQPFDLAPGVPFTFSGDADTWCAVPRGPTRDLNVMSDRQTTLTETETLQVAGRRDLASTGHTELVLVALTSAISATGALDDVTHELERYDTLHAAGEERLRLTGHGSLLVARFRRRLK